MESPLPPHIENPQEMPAAPAVAPIIAPPSPKQQSWGALISIVIIVLMVVVGAFYAWGQRIAEMRGLEQAAGAQ